MQLSVHYLPMFECSATKVHTLRFVRGTVLLSNVSTTRGVPPTAASCAQRRIWKLVIGPASARESVLPNVASLRQSVLEDSYESGSRLCSMNLGSRLRRSAALEAMPKRPAARQKRTLCTAEISISSSELRRIVCRLLIHRLQALRPVHSAAGLQSAALTPSSRAAASEIDAFRAG